MTNESSICGIRPLCSGWTASRRESWLNAGLGTGRVVLYDDSVKVSKEEGIQHTRQLWRQQYFGPSCLYHLAAFLEDFSSVSCGVTERKRLVWWKTGAQQGSVVAAIAKLGACFEL